MALSDRQLLDALSRTPFVDSTELAGILGEPHATVHRSLADLLADGIVRQGESWHRTPIVEPEVSPDGPRRRQSRLDRAKIFGGAEPGLIWKLFWIVIGDLRYSE